MYKILIVEDDLIIAKTVKNHIMSWGFEAECVTDFKDVLAAFVTYNPQLVLLDITLPFFNGYHWCSEIRRFSKVPIIFISSASDNMNIVMAMNMGGDDFIAKPFDLNVLTAKVQALLRRTYDFASQTNLLEHKGAILNTSDSTLNYQGRKIELSKNENKILQILLENKSKAVSRDTIMTRLWETDSYIDDNTLTVNITRLRKKLQEAALSDFITTKKGVGYLVE
jgi:two-component system, OmpR family, response regulator protein BraR/BceR